MVTAAPYVDTSLVVAYYVPEPLSARAQAILQARAGPAISELVELEFFSALSLRVRTGDRTRASARRVADLFLRHLEDGRYGHVLLHAGHYRPAREVVARFDLPLKVPDALHLAVCATEGLTLFTADQQLARTAAALGIDAALIDA